MNSEIRNNILCLSGDITVTALQPAAYQAFKTACRQNIDGIDLSGVGRADSACVSLLLTARRSAGRALPVTGLPESVRALSQLYEIQDRITP